MFLFKVILIAIFLAAPVAYAQTAATTPPTVEVAAPADEGVVTSADEQAAPDPGDVTAPPDNTWTIPYGSMIDGGAQVIMAALGVLAMGALTWAARLIPGMAGTAARMMLSRFGEKFIDNITDYAVNATRGATKGAKLDIPVGSEVIARAAEYGTSVGWKYLIDYLGGKEGIKQKVFRKIDVEPHVTAEALGVKPVALPYPQNRG